MIDGGHVVLFVCFILLCCMVKRRKCVSLFLCCEKSDFMNFLCVNLCERVEGVMRIDCVLPVLHVVGVMVQREGGGSAGRCMYGDETKW